VKALPLLPRELHLVVLGRPTKYKKVVENEAMRLGVADRLHFLHGVANDHLAAIYRQADCFVYPSRYEGFGIPIIEAIQSGLPVVAATGSCLEEAGGPDSLYVSPDDAEALAAAVVRSIDERQMRVERSRNYVKRFENTGVARQVMGIYEDLLCRK
jgi:glycosyltransferase involved in cell wall biosynthesis